MFTNILFYNMFECYHPALGYGRVVKSIAFGLFVFGRVCIAGGKHLHHSLPATGNGITAGRQLIQQD